MNMWRLNDTLLKNQWVNEGSKREFKNTFWQMKMEIKHTKLMRCSKSSYKRDIIVINAHIKK